MKLDKTLESKFRGDDRRFMLGELERITQLVERKGVEDLAGVKIYQKTFSPEHESDKYTISISKKADENGNVYSMNLEHSSKDDPTHTRKTNTSIKFRQNGNIISHLEYEPSNRIDPRLLSVDDAYSREFEGGPFKERRHVAYNALKTTIGAAVAISSLYTVDCLYTLLSQPKASFGYGMTVQQAETAGVAYPMFAFLSLVFGTFALVGVDTMYNGIKGFLKRIPGKE